MWRRRRNITFNVEKSPATSNKQHLPRWSWQELVTSHQCYHHWHLFEVQHGAALHCITTVHCNAARIYNHGYAVARSIKAQHYRILQRCSTAVQCSGLALSNAATQYLHGVFHSASRYCAVEHCHDARSSLEWRGRVVSYNVYFTLAFQWISIILN